VKVLSSAANFQLMPVKPANKKTDKPLKKSGQSGSPDSQPFREKKADDNADGGWNEPTTISVKPYNQLELSEKELKVEL
jgi:hypothetical protein